MALLGFLSDECLICFSSAGSFKDHISLLFPQLRQPRDFSHEVLPWTKPTSMFNLRRKVMRLKITVDVYRCISLLHSQASPVSLRRVKRYGCEGRETTDLENGPL